MVEKQNKSLADIMNQQYEDAKDDLENKYNYLEGSALKKSLSNPTFHVISQETSDIFNELTVMEDQNMLHEYHHE